MWLFDLFFLNSTNLICRDSAVSKCLRETIGLRFGFVGFPSSWDPGRAAVCDCGTPWTFLLPFCFRDNENRLYKEDISSLEV